MNQTHIRPATAGDAPAAIGLMAQLNEVAHGQIDAGMEDRFRAMLNLPGYAIFVAQDEQGQIVGLLTASARWTLWHMGPCAIIEELVVDEAARGQGAGRALIQAALEWAKAQACSEVEVSTGMDNSAAQAFYRRLGFTSEALLLEYELN
jgi:ribosomal protein S18 acetylase RimI-like enzyme